MSSTEEPSGTVPEGSQSATTRPTFPDSMMATAGVRVATAAASNFRLRTYGSEPERI
jgi:hypothetical protein